MTYTDTDASGHAALSNLGGTVETETCSPDDLVAV